MIDLIDYAKGKENQLNKVSDIRMNDSFKANVFDYRSNADVDYSRILYSSACRRLQGKMQLFIPKSDVQHRNRLTHSYEVAQIAKTIAKKCSLSDTLTVQTCSLAHDIGNPPFGHAGEIFLNSCSTMPLKGMHRHLEPFQE
jgi:dGTPase